MSQLIEILKELVPLWLAFLTILFVYLAYLYKRHFAQVILSSKEQSAYLKEKLDTVDRTQVIFERAINRQVQEIETLSGQLEDYRRRNTNNSISELNSLETMLSGLLNNQEELTRRYNETNNAVSELRSTRVEMQNSIERSIEKRLRASYSVKINMINGSDLLMNDLISLGYNPTFYNNWGTMVEIDEENESYDGLWFGEHVPVKILKEIIGVAKKRVRDIKYFYYHQMDGKEQCIFVASRTTRIEEKMGIQKFTESEINLLLSGSDDEFKEKILSKS